MKIILIIEPIEFGSFDSWRVVRHSSSLMIAHHDAPLAQDDCALAHFHDARKRIFLPGIRLIIHHSMSCWNW
jgi:hypothetical protein